MNSNPEIARAAREIASSLAKILELFFDEAQRTLGTIASKPSQISAISPISAPPATRPENPAEAVWVSKREMAKHLGVSVRTIDTWMARRRLPHVKLGRTVRFNLRDVDAHLKKLQRGLW